MQPIKIRSAKGTMLLAVIAFTGLISSCQKKGCTTANAINYNYDAKKDDGTCSYSKVVFYQQYPAYNGVPITRCEVFVNGDLAGSTSAYYPSGPGNCSAPGTVEYQIKSSAGKDWNSRNYLANGTVLISSGTIEPSHIEDCIKVNVTK